MAALLGLPLNLTLVYLTNKCLMTYAALYKQVLKLSILFLGNRPYTTKPQLWMVAP